MSIGLPPTAKLPAVSSTISLPLAPTPQCVGGPGEVTYGPVLLVMVIREPAWENRDGVPTAPLGVISMLLSRSPAERGLACVSFSTTVSEPAPGVMTAFAAQASLQPPVTSKKNGVAFATPPTASNEPAVTAPARSKWNFRIKLPFLGPSLPCSRQPGDDSDDAADIEARFVPKCLIPRRATT